MKPLLALLILTASALATTREITITGTFDHGSGLAMLDDPLQAFTLTARFETEAYDWNPSPTLGIYYFPDQPITLDFGSYHISSIGVIVRVFNGESGLWGVTVGNLNEIDAYGLTIPEYTGIYTVGFSTSAVFTTDGLENLTAGNLGSLPLNYALIEGDKGGEFFRVQDSGTRSTVIADVPEPGVMMLALTALAATPGRRLRK